METEKWCISMAVIIRIYHGAQSSECQINVEDSLIRIN